MNILVLGGTVFVGRHIVTEAVARGHQVTLFNRGTHPAPEGVAHVINGDRNGDTGLLVTGSWDAVIDTSAYFPHQVRAAAAALAGRVPHYTLISTISVYADPTVPHLDEDAELARVDDPAADKITNENYGGLKVLCEEELAAAFAPADRLIVRPGLVIGPLDHTDRFTYWPARVARGGEVLAPGNPHAALQWIDVRDLAAWILTSVENRLNGTYNAVNQADRHTMVELLATCARIAGSDGTAAGSMRSAAEAATFTWVDEEWLLAHGVTPFADLPFWLPGSFGNLLRVDGGRAQAAGLVTRSIDDTVRDTLEWHLGRGAPDLKAGMSAEREAELLAAWRGNPG